MNVLRFSTTRASHAAVPKRQDAPEIQLSSCSGPQPFQPGTSSRHPRTLQTETLGCAGRMAHSHGLILTWNSDLSHQTHTMMHRSRFCLTRPTGILCARCLLEPVRARPEVHRDPNSPLIVRFRAQRSDVDSEPPKDRHARSAQRRRRVNF